MFFLLKRWIILKRVKIREILVISSIILGLFLFVQIFNGDWNNATNDFDDNLNAAAEGEFILTQNFEASSYFISPYSSPGVNDEVYFSFMANMEGNYTLRIENFPNFLTDNINSENYVAFDNPSQTDLWYVSYVESDLSILGQQNLRMVISDDYGETITYHTLGNFLGKGQNFFEQSSYLIGSAVAAKPDTGVISVISWINRSNLLYMSSLDNGTSWSVEKNITSGADIGAESVFTIFGTHPLMDIGILGNGTIIVLIETPDPQFTDVVYIESYNNGTTWTNPRNITCLENVIEANKPKVQVDHNTGDYWLMWKGDNGDNETCQWAEYANGLSLSIDPGCENVTYDLDDNYDFIFDHKMGLFRVAQITWNSPIYELINFTCDAYGNPWIKESLGEQSDLASLRYLNTYYNLAHDGSTYHIMFKSQYSGTNTDIFRYIYYQNNTFWEKFGDFNGEEYTQIKWDGRTYEGFQINTSIVKVDFYAENITTPPDVNVERYIFIDKDNPVYNMLDQNRFYFNPLSGNQSYSEILWEILPSEACTAKLEVFRENKSASTSTIISSNNWDDTNPYMFVSDTNILYVLYESSVAGIRILNFIRSSDMGVTWSTPKQIHEESQSIDYFCGAAIGDFVFILVSKSNDEQALFRSFDRGENFQQEIDIADSAPFPSSYDPPVNMIITNNGTLYFTFEEESPDRYHVFKSINLGLNWTSDAVWDKNPNNDYNFEPDIAYDPQNDLVHVVLPEYNFSASTFDVSANFSFSTLNVSTNTWSALQDTGIFAYGTFPMDPYFVVTRENETSDSVVRLIYWDNLEVGGENFTFIYKEINSTDLGKTWNSPTFIDLTGHMALASNLDEIFYILTFTDGNDNELYYSRQGRLVRIIEMPLSTYDINEISFDGKDDFGEYIPQGLYNYSLTITDRAGNSDVQEGWMYADYNAPSLSVISVNTTFSPIPLFDVNISVIATDSIGFIIDLFYRKDGGSWNKLSMNEGANNNYSAVISGDSGTNLIEYYIKAVDLAGNEIRLDNNELYYRYDSPVYTWTSTGLFDETKTYSYLLNYTLTINITQDNEYIDKIFFNYSYNKGQSWDLIEFQFNGSTNVVNLTNITPYTNEIYYIVFLQDIFGSNTTLIDLKQIDLYQPTYIYIGTGLFDESQTYSSFQNYSFGIEIIQVEDLNHIDYITFNYSYNGGINWKNITFLQNGGNFTANLTSIPKNLTKLHYNLILTDIFGSNVSLMAYTRQINFYQPNYIYIGTGLFDESFTYSYLYDHNFTVEMVYQEDLNYIDYIYINYSYNNVDWYNLNFAQNGGNFTANLTNIPPHQNEIRYRLLLKDIFGKIKPLTDPRRVDFYQPQYFWNATGLFDPSRTYSSFQNYKIIIEMLNEHDLEYLNKTIFRYSYDKWATWNDKYFEQNGTTFELNIADLPDSLDELRYRLWVKDIFGQWTARSLPMQIDFYLPSTYNWTDTGLFEENVKYSSSQNYTFTITIAKEEDLNFIDQIFMNYSFDNGSTWITIIFQQNSPTYTANLSGIPEDLRELQYQIFLKDIFGNEKELTEVRIIDLYPEIPSIALGAFEMFMVILMAIGMGFLIAYGYIKLKGTSRDQLHKQIIISRLYEEMEQDSIKKKKEKGAKKEKEEKEKNKLVGATPFTKAYLGILCGTIVVLFIGYYLIPIDASVAIISLIGGLLMGVFGYMILMSRDITANIYLEKIRVRLFLLELFQMALLLFNILAILEAGNNINWFRYYLIEETYNLGVEIPKLYVSIIGVFFTSLVLVILITYLQLQKAVNNLQDQRREGASDNLLLYNKDQTSSRMITQMGFKTIVFLVSVLVAVITTTDLLNPDTGMLLLVIMGPFALSCLLVLLIHPTFEKRASKKKEEEAMPFIDSKKLCTKCGDEVFLQDKFCTSCGEQLILSQKMGTYIARCDTCGSKTYQNAEFCAKCGKKVEKPQE